MPRMLIFGLGYSARRIARSLAAAGWEVLATGSAGGLDFGDSASVRLVLDGADAVLSSVPPAADGDPVLNAYGSAIARAKPGWLGYLSSTGVYGDTGGAWVDESAPILGRRAARIDADLAWQALGARVFRLPGIYGPGRSALERVREGIAHRIDLPGQTFSRIHVDDLAAGVLAGLHGPPGAYNLADDFPCGQNDVVAFAAELLGMEPPPLVRLELAGLSPAARAFYAESRRVSNAKARRLLAWRPRHADFRAGLRAILAA